MTHDAEPLIPFEPREPVPDVVTDATALAEYATRLAAGDGPLALDAERASGFRYSQRAYLVQLRRAGAGTALIDPIGFPDLTPVQQATMGVEWVLHAATQDLPCLRELGLTPTQLFDTELAGRLLGRERVSLAALVESELGAHLEKGHGAADWSARPLSPDMLRYAALDVELLLELRDALETELDRAGKLEWARQEFAALIGFTPRDRGDDAWRRTSGMHRVRKPRALAVVRSMWRERDRVAQTADIAPGRVLPDASIVAAALALPASMADLAELPEFRGRGAQRRLRTWWAAVERARNEPDEELPRMAAPTTGPPPPRAWAEKRPDAAMRLEAARTVLTALSERVSMPVEQLLPPDVVRRALWDPVDPDALPGTLTGLGARPWQVELAGAQIAEALRRAARPAPVPTDE